MKQGKVTINDNIVEINNLTLVNEELAEHLNNYANPEVEISELILGGLQIAKYAKTTASINQIEHVGDRVQDGIEKVGKKTRKDIEDLLVSHTDPKNSKGLAKAIVDIASAQFISEFGPDNEDSPVNQLFMRLDSISRYLDKQSGAKEATDNSSNKGKNFNEVMSPIVQAIANNSSDLSEFVDAVASETGGRVGDEVVTINPDMTRGEDLKFVFEFKTAEKVTQASSLRELSEAMRNRGAKAGVFVVNKTNKTEKWNDYSFHSGNRMIIVVDKDKPDIGLIRFAYIHSRWLVTRDLLSDASILDSAKMQYLIEKAQDDAKYISQIRKSLTGIATSQSEAVTRVNELESRLVTTLDQAQNLLVSQAIGEDGLIEEFK